MSLTAKVLLASVMLVAMALLVLALLAIQDVATTVHGIDTAMPD
jgi:hypothetical protein